MFVKLLTEGMSEKDAFDSLKNIAGEIEGFTDTLEKHIDRAFVRSAAMSALISMMLISDDDFDRQFNAFFATFRKMLDDSAGKMFSSDVFKMWIDGNEFLKIQYDKLSKDRQDKVRQIWTDSKAAVYQDSVTEYISNQKAHITKLINEKRK